MHNDTIVISLMFNLSLCLDIIIELYGLNIFICPFVDKDFQNAIFVMHDIFLDDNEMPNENI